MKPLATAALLLTLAGLLSLPARAADEPKKEPAPAAQAGGEVSTLDGQIVPVGEKNKYLYSYKKWNVWTNPFGFFFGSYNLGGSYAFHRNFKLNLEPEGIYTYWLDDELYGAGFTLSGSVFFKKVYDGFYLEPGYSYMFLNQQNTGLDGSIHAFQLIGGWGWVWDSGFNINVGLGAAYYISEVDFEETGSYDGPGMAGNLQFGYTF